MSRIRSDRFGHARGQLGWTVACIVSFVIPLSLGACGKDKPLRTFVNTPPEIVSLTAEPDTLQFADTSVVTCTITDPNQNDIIRYHWSATRGRLISRDSRLTRVSWIAPDSAGPARVSVTVNDGTDSTSASVTVQVLGPSGTIVGTITSAADHQALSGAQLEIAGHRAVSNGLGAYRIDLVPPGLDTLRASADGYEPHAEPLQVRAGVLDTVDIELTPNSIKSRLHGHVTNSVLAAVPGATCRVAGLETLTNGSGEYEFAEVPRGSQALAVFRDGYVTSRDTLELTQPDVVHDVRLDASAPGHPDGTIEAEKVAERIVRVTWTPSGEHATLSFFDLYVEDNGAAPQLVIGGRLGPNGGSKEFTGLADHRYRFAVTAVNFEGESGFLSDPSGMLVLTAPSPLAQIPSGAFVMGSFPGGFGNEEHPGNPVFMTGAYGVETHEVTNRQYLAFLLEALDRDQLQVTNDDVRADGNALLIFSGSQIDPDSAAGGFAIVSGREDHPVAGVTWFGADAYARSVGRRLPTEAEWEKAARGTSSANGLFTGTEIGVGNPYPWGNSPPDAQHANYGGLFGSARPVESFPDGAIDWGGVLVYDLAGNVAEWCADWRGAYVAPHQPPSTGTARVVRGGHYSSGSPSSAPELLVGSRAGQAPDQASPRIGFRCAE